MSLSSDDEGKTKNSGISSVVSGMETPDINLSKSITAGNTYNAIGAGENVPNPNQNINTNFMDKSSYYTVLEQVPKNVRENEIYGSSHGYVIPVVESSKEATTINSDKLITQSKAPEIKEEAVEKEKKKEKKDKDKNLKKYRL